MIVVRDAHMADISVSITTSGFWVRGRIAQGDVDMTLSCVGVVRGALKALERANGVTIRVFDMTERVIK